MSIERDDKMGGQQLDIGNAESSDNTIPGSNTVKDPNDWTTGDEPMTGAQRSYLKTLSDEAGKRINELQQKTGRGIKERD